jgi:hypothetical protein
MLAYKLMIVGLSPAKVGNKHINKYICIASGWEVLYPGMKFHVWLINVNKAASYPKFCTQV